ncbi:hypothetical protein [Candidatus Palauibacter sp.]|uniref:hypothetical protein n=1 Tax=Candidatus Palauibacter sp. TaxID=3101350 RepID=UPI003B59FA2D
MRDDDAYLLDMLLSARDAREFAAELTFKKFEHEKLRQHAVIKAIEIKRAARHRGAAASLRHLRVAVELISSCKIWVSAAT